MSVPPASLWLVSMPFCLWTEIKSHWDPWQFNGLNLIFVALLPPISSLYICYDSCYFKGSLWRYPVCLYAADIYQDVCELQLKVKAITKPSATPVTMESHFSHDEHFTCHYWLEKWWHLVQRMIFAVWLFINQKIWFKYNTMCGVLELTET